MAPAEVIFQHIERICVLVAMAYVLSRWRIFSNLLYYRTSPRERFWVLAYFCILVAADFVLPQSRAPFVLPDERNLIGIGILASTSAGLLAGPWIGLGTGLFTAILSYVFGHPHPGSNGFAALVAGGLGGVVYLHRGQWRSQAAAGFLIAACAHSLRLGMILVPTGSALTWDAVLILYGATLVFNGLATALFVAVVADIGAQHQKIGRLQINKALQIANMTLPHLRPGLNEESARQIAGIILGVADVDAVALTDTERVLAHAGAGESHHRPGDPITLSATRRALEDGESHVAEHRSEIACPDKECPLSAAVVAPLFYQNRTIGAVEIYQTDARPVNAETIELAVGFAQFLSRYQMESAELQRQTQAASDAQLRALQAQIHPHFLFNTLNTLASLCRFDARRAESLTIQLGAFFRRTLKRNPGSMVTLEEELATVETYLEIEQARFGDSLEVIREIDASLTGVQIPGFILQPLVENAVLHGLSQKAGGGTLRIIARRRKGRVVFWVIDNGVGIRGRTPKSLLTFDGVESHGLSMLSERLRSLYAGRARIRIFSRPGKGTAVYVSVPEIRKRPLSRQAASESIQAV